jgi:hypothetical protein
MNRTILIAAIALLVSTAAVAQAERGERDPDKMAVIAATILVFDRDCEKVSAKIEEAAGVAVELAGKPKVVAAMMLIEDQIKRDGARSSTGSASVTAVSTRPLKCGLNLPVFSR